MTYRLGVDVGGTFTDLLLVDEDTGATHRAKTPSTPADQSRGVLTGIEKVCALAGIEPSAIRHVMHGTTIATNAVLEGKGARVGLIVTRGYRQGAAGGPLVRAGRPGRLDHLAQAGAAGRSGGHRGSGGAGGRARRGADRAGRAGPAAEAEGAARGRRRRDHHRADQQLRERRARAPDRRAGGRATARPRPRPGGAGGAPRAGQR